MTSEPAVQEPAVQEPDVQLAVKLLKSRPCTYCARMYKSIDPQKETKTCSECKYTSYCCVKHHRDDWGHHKKYCKFFCTIIDILNRFYNEADLFTDGEEWYSIPVVASEKLVQLDRMVRNVETIIKLASEKGMKNIPEYNNPITPQLKRYLQNLEESKAPGFKVFLSLQSKFADFHEIIYGLVQPKHVLPILNFLESKKINTIVDPMAGVGLLEALFCAYDSDNHFDFKCSDLNPQHHLVEKKNALDPSVYDGLDFEHTVVVISWPDFGAREGGPSTALIRLLHTIGVKYLLILIEDYQVSHTVLHDGMMEAAFCPTGKALLNELYTKIKIPEVEQFVILKDRKVSDSIDGAIDPLSKFLTMQFDVGVGQSTYFYQRK